MIKLDEYTVNFKCKSCKKEYLLYSDRPKNSWTTCKGYLLDKQYPFELRYHFFPCDILNLLYTTKKEINSSTQDDPVDPVDYTYTFLKRLNNKTNLNFRLEYNEYDDEFKDFLQYTSINDTN
jgi:hypothetical protein